MCTEFVGNGPNQIPFLNVPLENVNLPAPYKENYFVGQYVDEDDDNQKKVHHQENLTEWQWSRWDNKKNAHRQKKKQLRKQFEIVNMDQIANWDERDSQERLLEEYCTQEERTREWVEKHWPENFVKDEAEKPVHSIDDAQRMAEEFLLSMKIRSMNLEDQEEF